MNNNIPDKIFLTKGVGIHRERLASFELALRDAGTAFCNLVYVSSILPPGCTVLSKDKGLALCVMSRIDTNEPNRLIAAAIGMALPHDPTMYGYLSEHSAYGETQDKAGDYAEDLAASMLSSILGAPFNVEDAWDTKKQIWSISGKNVTTRSICQSSEGHKDGLGTSAIAAAIML